MSKMPGKKGEKNKKKKRKKAKKKVKFSSDKKRRDHKHGYRQKQVVRSYLRPSLVTKRQKQKKKAGTKNEQKTTRAGDLH